MELETLSSQLATATYDRDQFRQRAEALDADLTALHRIRSQLDDSLKALREEHTVEAGVRGDLTKHNRELAGEIHRYVERGRRMGDRLTEALSWRELGVFLVLRGNILRGAACRLRAGDRARLASWALSHK
jgi:hypothetical protein